MKRIETNNINLKKGKLLYDELCIDFNKPFVEQLDCLTEDLIQILYEEDYLIDVGWYPEYDENGQFKVNIIYKNNWDIPIYRKEYREGDELEKGIRKAIDFLDKRLCMR